MDDGSTIYSYVAIRSDEQYREGYSSKFENLKVRLPFKEAGIDKLGVLDILEGVGLGLPAYYEWRTAKWLYVLFLPAEDRVGTTDGAASRVL